MAQNHRKSAATPPNRNYQNPPKSAAPRIFSASVSAIRTPRSCRCSARSMPAIGQSVLFVDHGLHWYDSPPVTSAPALRLYEAPYVQRLVPAAGPVHGGTPLTIGGLRLSAGGWATVGGFPFWHLGTWGAVGSRPRPRLAHEDGLPLQPREGLAASGRHPSARSFGALLRVRWAVNREPASARRNM